MVEFTKTFKVATEKVLVFSKFQFLGFPRNAEIKFLLIYCIFSVTNGLKFFLEISKNFQKTGSHCTPNK